MSRSGRILACTPIILLLAVSPLVADDEPENPKTVLVLSGGGARGMAHIGVLEVLEEMRIPVDVIIGTSMGAIIGGMYASGISPEEMRARLEEIDWGDAFDDEPPRKFMPFRRKEEDRIPLFRFELGIKKHGLVMPSGLVAGQKLNFILRTMLIRSADKTSFDDLPIPFRAVATDLESGDMIVIDHGDLSQALRASMAFPVLFTPVDYDGMNLVDGGVVRNMPVDVALEMGAERIIAVDVGSKLKEFNKKDPSPMAVMRRTQSIMSRETRTEQLELIREQDILITPELDGVVSFADFGEVETAVEIGEAAARVHEDRLRDLAVSADAFDAYLKHHRAGTSSPPAVITAIEIHGLVRISEKRIRRLVKTKPGTGIELDSLEEDLVRVYLTGAFQTVEFQIDYRGDVTVLVIDVEEKSWGPWFTRVGLGLDTNFRGRGEFSANLLLRRTELNRFGAEWRTVVRVGSEDSAFTEFYQPLSYAGTWFAVPAVSGRRDDDERIFTEDGVFLANTEDERLKLDVGRALRHWGEIRVGVHGGKTEIAPSSSVGQAVKSDLGAYSFRFVLDRIDNPYFPKAGVFFQLSGRASRDNLGAEYEYDRVQIDAAKAWKLGRFRLVGKLGAGTDLGSGLPLYDDFRLGGLLNLSGLQKDQLRGSRMAHGAIVFYRQINDSEGPFGSNFYVGGSVEGGNTWAAGESATASTLNPSGSLFVAADTMLGPLYFAYGKTDAYKGTWYLILGPLF